MDAGLLSGNGQILTRTAEGDNVNGFNLVAMYFRNASEVLHVRKAKRCHGNRERFDFAGPHGFDSVHRTGERESA